MSGPLSMPRLGQDMAEGTILEWVKQPGDQVEAGETVAVIETDKVEVEFEAPAAGWLREILVPAGATAAVATPIAWLTDTPDEPYGPGAPDLPAAEGAAEVRVPASPRARAAARRLGVDLAAATPTGPDGWVTEQDVERLAGTQPAPAAAAGPAPPAPVPAMRRAIAAQMTRSATIPQFRVTRDCDLTGAAEHREELQVGWTDLILWAAAHALRRHPEVNASWVDGPAPAIVRHQRIVIGLAVAVPDGLLVPVLADPDTLDLRQLHTARRQVETAARAGTLTAAQLQGATFTVSNLGAMGVDQFDALVNPPEAGILAVGRVGDRPVVDAGVVRVATTVRLTFSGDHRVLDGAAGARFLATVAGLLRQGPPGRGGEDDRPSGLRG
jgi:pyruvate dehydrogenase E2 component (dihydrolipoamide acetyltransferase)